MMILSILTPAIPARWPQIELLCAKIEKQTGPQAVEHLVLCDNKRRSVGLKRDALLRAARGKYVAFVDDDDDVSADYVDEILKAAADNPDVITFLQDARVNGKFGLIEFKLGSPNESFQEVQVFSAGGFADDGPKPRTKRNAWHVCAWRRALAIQSHFPDNSYGEDWAFAAPLCSIAGLRDVHIPKVLHYYRHSTATTHAPPPVR